MAILAALVSAALVILIQVLTTWNRNRRDYQYLVRSLKDEVKAGQGEAAARGLLRTVDVVLLPPLSEAAWQTFRSSQHRWRLDENQRRALENFYASIALANAQLSAVPSFLQVAATAPDEEVRDEYRLEASRLASRPMKSITDAAPAAVAALEAATTWRRRMLLP